MYRRSKRWRYYVLLVIFASCIVLVGAILTGWMENIPIKQLPRPEWGQETTETSLYMDNGEDKRFVTVNVNAREKSYEEVQTIFTQAKKELLQQLKGENESLLQVTKPLSFPVSAADGQVMVSWSSNQPEYIAYDGTLGETIPQQGAVVELEATIQCQQYITQLQQEVTVWPATDKESIAQILQEMDTDRTGEYYKLPSTFQGKQVLWYEKRDNPAPAIAMLVLVLGILLPLRRVEEEKQQKNMYREQLLQAYPNMVSQLSLYLGAGMSVSQSISAMAVSKTGKMQDVLQKECALIEGEMKRGVSESEAILHLGDRSGLWEYKSFCSLLLQNRKEGNAKLLIMLQREAEKAFADRQRRAKVIGNEATAKLLLPMTLLLLIVLLLVLFPAMLSFY